MSKTLTVYLAADVSKLTQGLNTGKAQLGLFSNGLSGISTSLSNMLGPALIGAGVAAGAMAAKFAVDGVKGFIEDEAAAAKLATTLGNLGLGQATTEVETLIDSQQRLTGVSDSELRPAMSRLLTSTRDVAEAQKALQLALDISAGTGKDLLTVSNSLAKGFDGSTTALGKLGAGLDKTLLATGDMEKITAALSQTFAGQASTAAGTYQGQINRMSVAFDELGESLGRGLITSLGDTESQTDSVMTAMQDLEPVMETIGRRAGETATSILKIASGLGEITGATVPATEEMNQFQKVINYLVNDFPLLWNGLRTVGNIVGNLTQDVDTVKLATEGWANGLRNLSGQAIVSANDLNQLDGQIEMTTRQFIRFSEVTAGSTKTTADQAERLVTTTSEAKKYVSAINSAGGASSTLKDENEKLTATYDKQAEAVKAVTQTMTDQVKAVAVANQAVADYQQSISDSIMGAIQLGDVQKMGKDIGVTTLDAFQMQIDQAAWFGNVLESIKAQGADQLLIDQLASLGPGAGGALAQEMIDKGLVQTFSDKLVDVVAAANTVAQSMVPEFLVAGQDSANATLNGMIETTKGQTDKLQKLGKSIGSTIGDNVKAEILKSVAEALKAAEDARSAAAAAQAARQAANQAASDQQIAQSLQRLMTNSNARGGYMDVSNGAGVLG